MPPFQNNGDQIRKCEGPCGRMTRNTKMSKADYPDTVCRVNGTHCQFCHKRLVNEGKADPLPREAERDARKERLAIERLAAAERARLQIVRERAARAAARIPRRVGMGQTGVRI